MILLDTSGLLAALFPDQSDHEGCAQALRTAKSPLLLSPFVLAELDYLTVKLAGVEVELEVLSEVSRGAYQLAPFTAADIAQAETIIERYRDLELGLADASLVVLAERHGARDILSLDERHFRALPAGNQQPFRILPADLH